MLDDVDIDTCSNCRSKRILVTNGDYTPTDSVNEENIDVDNVDMDN